MTYRELYESATRKLEKSEITLGEYEEMTKSLNEDVRTWIPVTERLPEKRLAVLVWCPEYKNIYCAYLDREQWWIFGTYTKLDFEVVAWQPLPEPYKAESEE